MAHSLDFGFTYHVVLLNDTEALATPGPGMHTLPTQFVFSSACRHKKPGRSA